MVQQKKGLPIWAWFGIGCLALIFLVVVVFMIGGFFLAKKVQDVAGDFENNPEMAAARLIVRMNPEIEEVEIDEEDGTITFREKDSGKVYTASFEDLKEGRFSITGEDGEVVVKTEGRDDDGQITITTDEGTMKFGGSEEKSDQPDWVPVPSGATVGGHFSMQSDDSSHGTVEVVTDEDAEDVLAFYKGYMEDNGYTVQTSSFSGDGESVTVLQGHHEESGRTLVVNLATEDGELKVGLTYTEEK